MGGHPQWQTGPLIHQDSNSGVVMNLRALACVCGLLGGAAWVARVVLDGGTADVLFWAGLVLLFLALVGLGTGLVSKGALWLQAIVGIAFPLLVWSVVATLHETFDPVMVDAVVGVAVAVVSGVAFRKALGQGRPPKPPKRTAGAHAR